MLRGTAGADSLEGFGGDDRLTGGDGADTLDGGEGNDTVDYSGETGPRGVIVNLSSNLFLAPVGHPDAPRSVGPGEALDTFSNYDTLISIETVVGTANDDWMVGSAGANWIETGAGNDTVNANGGNDFIYFGGALDENDSVDGGAGTDTLGLLGDYSAGLTLSGDQLAGIERLVMYSGIQIAPGTDRFDYSITTTDSAVAAGAILTVFAPNLQSDEQLIFNGLAETNGRFWIRSGAGNDILVGGDQADSIQGGAGDDQLYGRGGDDYLVGGLGADQLRGGFGVDRFHYDDVSESTAASMDTITDFTHIDRIDLRSIDADGNATNGDTAFTFIGSGAFSNVAGQLRATNTSGNIWLVEGDVDGDGNADIVIQVTLLDTAPLTGADFML